MKTPRFLAHAALIAGFTLTAGAQPGDTPQSVTVFSDVRIFDGKSTTHTAPMNVLVRGNKIEKISAQPIATDRRADTVLIDGGGRTRMPGLIDAHVHTMMESIPLQVGLTSEISCVALVAAKAAEAQLLRGFTSVRDVGGASFALKRAIDEGAAVGPRIYPSGHERR